MFDELAGMMAANKAFDPEKMKKWMAMTPADWLQWQIQIDNEEEGTLCKNDGYDCRRCRNKGYIAVEGEGGTMVYRNCACRELRETLRRTRQSGLGSFLTDYSFEKYTTRESWQQHGKATAMRFCEDRQASWFFIGGAVGSGKTHLCVAIAGHYLQQNKNVRYMLWSEDSKRLKAVVNEDAAYRRLLEPLKKAEVLYIDDFWKTRAGDAVSAGDINIAFELLDNRYRNPNRITIISSEKSIRELLDIDEAIGSRIVQRAGSYLLTIPAGRDKNYRLQLV